MKDLIINSSTGSWGEDENSIIPNHTKCLVIRATEFDNKYNLNLENSRVKYRNISNAKLSRMQIAVNDILIEKSGGSEDQPVGRVAYLNEDILKNNFVAYSNFIHKITICSEKCNPYYVFEYLRLMHNIKITEVMQNQTNGIRNLIMNEYMSQFILLPDKAKQTKIAKCIIEIKDKAKRLQFDVESILNQAKKEVEMILLGGEL